MQFQLPVRVFWKFLHFQNLHYFIYFILLFSIPYKRSKSRTTLFETVQNKRFGCHRDDFSAQKKMFLAAYIYTRGYLNMFPDFFVWELLLIVYTGNSSSLRSNLLRMQCTACTVPTTSGRPHRSLLVSACQWPSSKPLSSSQFSHNDSLWA